MPYQVPQVNMGECRHKAATRATARPLGQMSCLERVSSPAGSHAQPLRNETADFVSCSDVTTFSPTQTCIASEKPQRMPPTGPPESEALVNRGRTVSWLEGLPETQVLLARKRCRPRPTKEPIAADSPKFGFQEPLPGMQPPG